MQVIRRGCCCHTSARGGIVLRKLCVKFLDLRAIDIVYRDE
jgi:hypothetical protein